jgi:hypothetical protein
LTVGEILNLLARADPVSVCVVFGVYWAIDRRMRRQESQQSYMVGKLEELLRAHEMQGVSHVGSARTRTSA